MGGAGSVPGAPGINSRLVWSGHNFPQTPRPTGSWDKTPFCGREGEEGGAPKPPKNAAAPGPLQGQPGWGGRSRAPPQRWKQSCIHTMDLSSLALALNKSHQPRNSCWRVWPKARGEAMAPSRVLWGVCGGAQPCSSPHATRHRAQRTQILHEKAKSPAVTGAGTWCHKASCEKLLF